MKKSSRFYLPFLLIALAIIGSVPSSRAGEKGDARIISITARRFEFTPKEIQVPVGATVILQLTSEDVRHGFFNRALKIDADLEPGKTTSVTISPETPGTYLIICDRFCGAQHGNMKFSLVVTP